MSETFPLFPLGTCLVPHGLLSLQVFEPRYLTMMDDLTRPGAHPGPEFGVVLIARGSEVGGGDTRSAVGTRARVVQAHRFDDGRWGLVTVGTTRFRVREWLADDPYPRAVVDSFEDTRDNTGSGTGGDTGRGTAGPDPGMSGRLGEAERQVRRALALAAELGEPAAGVAFELAADPVVATWQLSGLAPLGAFDRQRLLETRSPSERLDLLVAAATDVAEVLAFRLAGG